VVAWGAAQWLVAQDLWDRQNLQATMRQEHNRRLNAYRAANSLAWRHRPHPRTSGAVPGHQFYGTR
jgi:hypothetical protein